MTKTGMLRDTLAELAQVLLPHCSLLPPEEFGDAVVLLGSAVARQSADPRAVLEFGRRFAGQIPDTGRNRAKALIAAADALFDRDTPSAIDSPPADVANSGDGVMTGESSSPVPAPVVAVGFEPTFLAGASSDRLLQGLLNEVEPFLDHTNERTLTLHRQLCELAETDEGAARARFANVVVAIAASTISGRSPEERARLVGLADWALAYDSERADGVRMSTRLNQFSVLLAALPEDERDRLLLARADEMVRLTETYGKQKYLHAMDEMLDNHSHPDLVRIHVAVTARLAAVPQGPTPSVQPPRERPRAAQGQMVDVGGIVPQLRAAMDRAWDSNSAVTVLERVEHYLDPNLVARNSEKFEALKGGDLHAGRLLASVVLAGAAYRALNRPPGHADAFRHEDLDALIEAAGFAASSSAIRNDALKRTLKTASLHLLGQRLLQPSGYVGLVEQFAQLFPDELGREQLRELAITDLDQFLRTAQRRGEQLLTASDAEAWLDAMVDWGSALPAAARSRVAALLREHGAPDSLALHQLTTGDQHEDRPEMTVFGPQEQQDFEAHYQQGLSAPIGALLDRNSARLLAVCDAALTDELQTQFVAPTQRPAGLDVALTSKTKSGSAAEARQAYEGFDRALQAERRPHARAVLAEWKAYAEYRANSVFAAEPLWRAAVESGSASKEVLWNIAVRRKQTGQPVSGLKVLEPSLDQKRQPMSFVRFGCALAVAELRRPTAEKDPEDTGYALRFLLRHAFYLPVPAVQLLWFWTAHQLLGEQGLEADDSYGQAIVRYTRLTERPLTVPTVDELMRLDARTRTPEIDRLHSELDQFQGAFRVTWRLWIAEFALRNTHWWGGWDRWATACVNDADVSAAVDVLKQAADSAVRGMRRRNAPQPQRDRSVSLLRSAVQRMLHLQRDSGGEALLAEIRDVYVLPYPELNDNRPQNRSIRARLGITDEPRTVTAEPPPAAAGVDRVWISLHADLLAVAGATELTLALYERVGAALKLERERAGGFGALVDSVVQLVDDVWRLQGGLSHDTAADHVLGLANRLQRVAADAASARLEQFAALTAMLERVVASVSREVGAVPAIVMTVDESWIGWPADGARSSIPLVVSFDGPGEALDVRVLATWADPDAAVAGEARLERVVPGSPVACAIAVPPPPAGVPSKVVLDATYRWGLIGDAIVSATVLITAGDFIGHLRENHIQAHELPNPYVTDVPLTRDQVTGSLFQGRESQLQAAREYDVDGFPPMPLCFYGMRKTGKTSLLRRVLVDLSAAGLLPLEIDLVGLNANVLGLGELCFDFLNRIARAAVEAGADADDLRLPENYPAPLALIDPFFEALKAAFAPRKVVLLLDEFQYLLGGGITDPILDVLRPVHESGRVGLIMFPNQGQDPAITMRTQLAMRSLRVDFLSESEVGQLVRESVVGLGVTVHPSSLERFFEQAAGQPNFTALLAQGAIDRLNVERRNVLTVSDVDAAAQKVLADEGKFSISWFSYQNVTPDEAEAAIALANRDDDYSGVSVNEAEDHLGIEPALERSLEAKRLIEFAEPNVRIRGRLLWAHLRRQVSAKRPPARRDTQHTVGVFVDFENVRNFKPSTMSYREFGQRIMDYASSVGDVRSAMIVVASWNTRSDWDRTKAELQSVGFLVEHEPDTFSPTRRDEKRDAADVIIFNRVPNHVAEHQLTDVVFVTGDGDFLIAITELLSKKISVRLIHQQDASLSGSFQRLFDQRDMEARGRGVETDFHMTPLPDLLR